MRRRVGDLSTPVLIVLTDFSNTDIATYLPNPEPAWSNLMFGRNQGQANHYWYEVSIGQFQLIKAHESYGQADNGVVHVKLAAAKPKADASATPQLPERSARCADSIV